MLTKSTFEQWQKESMTKLIDSAYTRENINLNTNLLTTVEYHTISEGTLLILLFLIVSFVFLEIVFMYFVFVLYENNVQKMYSSVSVTNVAFSLHNAKYMII